MNPSIYFVDDHIERFDKLTLLPDLKFIQHTLGFTASIIVGCG